MPLSERQIVVSRYISLLITTGCGVLWGIVIGVLAFATGKMDLTWTQWLLSMVQTVLAALLYMEIEIPVMYRFGVERGRIVNILLFIILFAGVSALAELVFGAVWVVILLCFPVSIAVSMRIRAKKEY